MTNPTDPVARPSRQGDGPRWPTVCTDEDGDTGFMYTDGEVPEHPTLRLGLFLVLARREFGDVFDPAKITASQALVGFAYDDPDEPELSHRAREGEEPDAGEWWLFDGLDEARVGFGAGWPTFDESSGHAKGSE